MVKNQYGETSWDAELKSSGGGKGRDLYMKLVDGNNIMRIITQPFEYLVHTYKEEGDTGFGDKVMCSAFHGSCVLCAQGNLAKRRWYIGLIDRKTQSYKILDIGYTVFQTLQGFFRDEDYGDLKRYDIDIKVNKQGGATGYYHPVPKPAKPLSAADLELIERVDENELLRKVTPPTPEKVQERLDAIKNGKAFKPLAGKPSNNKAKAAVDMTGDDSELTFASVKTED